jgi:hypothetical protein
MVLPALPPRQRIRIVATDGWNTAMEEARADDRA